MEAGAVLVFYEELQVVSCAIIGNNSPAGCSSASRTGSWSSVSILGGATSSKLCNNRQK